MQSLKTLVFPLVILLFLFSCEKECYDCPECIFGRWEMIKSCGGITGACCYPDKKAVLKFSENYQVACFYDGDLIAEYDFEFSGDQLCGQNKTYAIIVHNGNNFEQVFNINERGILTICTGFSWATYKRD